MRLKARDCMAGVNYTLLQDVLSMTRAVSLQRERIRKRLGAVLTAEKNHGHEGESHILTGKIGLRAFCKGSSRQKQQNTFSQFSFLICNSFYIYEVLPRFEG